MKHNRMFSMFCKTAVSALGVLTLSLVSSSAASAQCGGYGQPGLKPSSFILQLGHPRLLQAALVTTDEDAPIVGFWHVKFISKGSKGIPDGTEVDAGYSQWHSDHTEIMNSGGRSPITGNFCLGVWKKVGESTYRLNHLATAWDSTGATLVGPANILEEVTLRPDGNSFEGNFTIHQFSESGTSLALVTGYIEGTRIDVETPPSSIF